MDRANLTRIDGACDTPALECRSGGNAKTMKKQAFREFKGRVQLLGLWSVVFLWLGVLRAVSYGLQRDFP